MTALGLADKSSEDAGALIEVPEGHYAEDSMKQTVVPNRNMIMLSIAIGVAVNEKAERIGIGVHAGDHFVYPDCRPTFINAMDLAAHLGNEGFHHFDLGLPKSNGARQWNEDKQGAAASTFLVADGTTSDGPI